MRLEGRRVRLEPLRLAHAARLWAAARDAGTWRFMGRRVASPEDLAAWVDERVDAQREGRALAWMQVAQGRIPRLPGTRWGTPVGCTALFDHRPRDRQAEVGHTWLAPAARGTGLNAEAKLLVLSHAFGPLGLERVQLRTDALNRASRRAILALGASFEGVLRHHRLRPNGTWRDTAVYSILRDEWPAVRSLLRQRLQRKAKPVARPGP